MPSHIGLTYALGGCYGILCLVFFIQVFKIIYYKHNRFSFQFGFLAQCFVWTLLRVIGLLSSTDGWPTWLFLTVFWTPIVLMFSTFLLLIVFYAHIIHRRDWAQHRMTWFCVYAICTTVLTVVTTVTVVVSQYEEDEDDTTFTDRLHTVLTGIAFGLLAAWNAYFGVRLFILEQTEAVSYKTGFFKKKGERASAIVAIAFLIALSFFSRGIYNVLASVDVVSLSYEINDDGYVELTVTVFLLLLVWEVIPPMLLVLYFKDVPTTNVGRLYKIPWLRRLMGWDHNSATALSRNLASAPYGELGTGSDGTEEGGSPGEESTEGGENAPPLPNYTPPFSAASPTRYKFGQPHPQNSPLGSSYSAASPPVSSISPVVGLPSPMLRRMQNPTVMHSHDTMNVYGLYDSRPSPSPSPQEGTIHVPTRPGDRVSWDMSRPPVRGVQRRSASEDVSVTRGVQDPPVNDPQENDSNKSGPLDIVSNG
eukprot:Rmarinus@m.25070